MNVKPTGNSNSRVGDLKFTHTELHGLLAGLEKIKFKVSRYRMPSRDSSLHSLSGLLWKMSEDVGKCLAVLYICKGTIKKKRKHSPANFPIRYTISRYLLPYTLPLTLDCFGICRKNAWSCSMISRYFPVSQGT
jgi:hypothetical protein